MPRPSAGTGHLPVDIDEILTALQSAETPHERETLESLVVERSARLVSSAAHRYSHRGIDTDDLVAVANLALVKAIRGFHAERGDFFAYAAATIHGDLKKHFRDQGWTIRPPRQVQEMQAAIGHATETIQAAGHQPTTAELAHEIGTSEQSVSDAQAAGGCYSPVSLDVPGPHGAHLGDRIGDDDGDPYATIDDWTSFVPLWRTLTDDDRLLLRLRFFDELSQERIAPFLGISQMQVSRRLRSLLARLRDAAGAAAVPA